MWTERRNALGNPDDGRAHPDAAAIERRFDRAEARLAAELLALYRQQKEEGLGPAQEER